VPVLARLFEAAGVSTILVTNMPFWAERVGAPRVLAVEFPFGHILGRPGDRNMQMRVIDRALEVLEQAETPGTIVHFQEKWPEPLEKALHDSHPEQPPPIMGQMGRHIGSFLRGMRRGGR
jgi:D-proline reductase (dithiol) PrdB